MATSTPGNIDPELLTQESISEMLRRPILQPLPQSQVYQTNGTYGRLCTLHPKPQQYLSQGPTREEERRRREEQRYQMNTIGLWAGGLLTSGGAFVRLLGGSEDAVESAAQITFDILSEHTPGGH